MDSSSKKLIVKVLEAKDLIGKNAGNRSDPYVEVVVLDDKGTKIGRTQYTDVIKSNLNPTWNQSLEFSVTLACNGLKVRVWDKHKFRSDKFMGQATIKFNNQLLNSSEKQDEWFILQKRKSKEDVSGKIHLEIQYGELKDGVPLVKGKERTQTLVGEQSVNDLKISPAWGSEVIKQKLAQSPFTQVDEIQEDEENEDFEGIREGPSTASMERLNKDYKDLVFSKGDLEILNNSNNYYALEYAKSNVRVNSGKWYFEVKLLSTGQIQIGVCTNNYNPKTLTGDAWTYDGSRQMKIRKGKTDMYGQYWNMNDIIGCGFDIEAKTVQYWRNGQDLGIAFSDLHPTGGTRITPMIVLPRRAKVLVNFGKEKFSYPQALFHQLHSFLSEKEISQLNELFAKYRDISLKDAEQDGQLVEKKDSIFGAGFLEFSKDLGVTEDDDLTLLIVASKLKCETLWEISKEEFITGFTIFGCSSVEKIKEKIKEWKQELKDSVQFRNFYNFVFDYLKEDKKMLVIEEAISAWNTILKEKPWLMFRDFQQFLQEEEKKAISKDVWLQMWHFMQAFPNNLTTYDSDSSWPLLFDEFHEWYEKKQKSTN